jgi:hypothetical protein
MSLADPSVPDLADMPPGPLKCDGAATPEHPAVPCAEPGTLPRCQICPASPTYWRRRHGHE